MPSPSFTLDAQLRFHDKWLKIDLQRAFSPEGLSEMWNEMVKDEEITFNGEESAHPGIYVSGFFILSEASLALQLSLS
uniref:Uncharacterized protein n=1 Tax=Pundamilia nyererei TaxID=303518 RepID=A0A3B4GKC3_9CICH